ncbi:uncharacterized protein LOC109814671 [Cajanus cajan]|uniref:uncharacterized protein LOC109814671 n=1 Tax=Cajanus cajan TaxID=3821 RepID=UPI00098DB53A|nr:uncharacterized protein LOC109814671 [Cajanus cajan]
MISPRNLKQVQQLAGRLTALSRFLPCLAEITKPVVRLLRKANKFEWSDECEKAFQTLKERLGSPPVLSKPDPEVPIVVYLCVSNDTISTVLIQEKEGQQPIYFVSRMLQEAETRYQLLEKVALGLVHTARRLRQYFQSHQIIVRTDCPIAKVLRKPELAGRMMAWSIELSEFDICFQPRGPIKSQCLVDFINELQPRGCFVNDLWTIHVDGSSNNQGSGAGIILEGPTGLILEQSLRFEFKASNNQAEYEALLAGLRLAREIGVNRLECWTDSKVVAEQVNDNFQVKDANLLKYYHLFQQMCGTFEEVYVKHTSREHNARADQLARLASSTRKPGQLRTTLHLDLETPSVVAAECLVVEGSVRTWITEIMDYLEHGTLPSHPTAAKKLRTQAARYVVIGGDLYRRGFSAPLLKCVEAEQANYILREMHEGICGFHSGGRTLATKVLRAGYYWPTLREDCVKFVKHCVSCQRHGNLIHASAEELHGISSPWPFAMWGMDILGPFPIAKGQCKFLLVAVDYFTKWVEAEPLANITAANVQKFLWKNIITRFGIPYALVSDNGLQFTDQKLNRFIHDLGIKHRFTSVEHPSTDECAALKDKIEDLIKQGKLHNFVDRSGSSQNRSYQPRYQDRHRQDRSDKTSDRVRRERSRSRERKDDSAPSHRRVINTIAGGFAGGGTTSSAQKRHLRAIRSVNTVHRQSSRRLPAITFTDADFKGIDPEQDDPMVISVEIHNCIVKKTLIDQGSSADIIYWNTFKLLGISEKELLPYDDPLVGFAGERVSTKGYIKLFTRFCFDEQESREVQTKEF